MKVHLGVWRNEVRIAEPSFQCRLVPCDSRVLQPRRIVESRHTPGLPPKHSGQPRPFPISLHRMTTRAAFLECEFSTCGIAGSAQTCFTFAGLVHHPEGRNIPWCQLRSPMERAVLR